MDIEPEIPEGINYSKAHPLADFGLMLLGAVGFVLVIVALAHVLAGFLVGHIPFETEKQLLETFKLDALNVLYEDSEEFQDQQQALQDLANRLSAHMDLPEGMVIQAHYDPSEIPNAFATLAGNIVIHQGLIDNTSSENGLAMVVAHEIAHIKHRDPMMSLGRGVVAMVGIAALSGFGDASVMANVAGFTSASALSQFSRDQESRADEDAVAAVLAEYGTLNGADEFFTKMLSESDASAALGAEFFSTHPPTDERIARINSEPDSSSEPNNLPDTTRSSLRPLPKALLADSEVGTSNATED